MGGNLTLIAGTIGTPWQLDTTGRIIFIEDVGEKPYQVDRMINNLRLSGVLENLKGLVVGQFSDYEEDESMGKTVYELIKEAVEEYDYPVAFGFPAGHVEKNMPLMIGARAELSVKEDGVTLNFNCKQPKTKRL